MKSRNTVKLRRATAADAGNVRAMQDAALRIAARRCQTVSEIEGYLAHIGTLDGGHLAAGRVWVAEIEGEIVASGSWGEDGGAMQAHVACGRLVPDHAAFIRGVYSDPAVEGQGVARLVLEAMEGEIAAEGYASAAVAATYTAMPFFQSSGYLPSNLVSLGLPGEIELNGVVLGKALDAPIALAA